MQNKSDALESSWAHPPVPVCRKIIFHKTSPWYQKAWSLGQMIACECYSKYAENRWTILGRTVTWWCDFNFLRITWPLREVISCGSQGGGRNYTFGGLCQSRRKDDGFHCSSHSECSAKRSDPLYILKVETTF